MVTFGVGCYLKLGSWHNEHIMSDSILRLTRALCTHRYKMQYVVCRVQCHIRPCYHPSLTGTSKVYFLVCNSPVLQLDCLCQMLQKFSKTLIKNKSVLCDHGNLCANKNIEVLQQTVKQEFPTALDRIGRNLISKINFKSMLQMCMVNFKG